MANQLDILVVHKEHKEPVVIDPTDSNIRKKQYKKLEK